jgi:FK506-binding nuclear protein
MFFKPSFFLIVSVMLVSDDNAYLLCTLRKGSICQVPLDLNFAEGDKISFSTKGNGIVHLTGYLIPEGDDFGMDESDSDEGEDASAELEKLMGKEANGKKAKAEKPKKAEATKAKKEDSDSDEEEEEDDDSEEAEGEEGSDDEMEFEDAESGDGEF